MIRSIRVASVLLLAVVAAPLVGATLADEVSWVAGLPGVTRTASQQSDNKVETTYAVMADGASMMSTLRGGLVKRGWTFEGGGVARQADAEARAIRATKGDLSIQVGLTQAGGLSILAIQLERTGAAPEKEEGTAEITGDSNPMGSVVKGNAEVIINDEHATKSYECNDSEVTINSNDGALTFTGSCRTMNVNGNRNRVTIDGTIHEIFLNGNGNRVQWSGAKNQKAPDVTDNGNGNAVTKSAK